MTTTDNNPILDDRKIYYPPEIIQKSTLRVELQTNVLPDEPPPPM